jgi:hypothetical protein
VFVLPFAFGAASATLKPSMVGRLHTRAKVPSLSVIVVVRDDEDTVGGDVRALAHHLRARGLDFEILAIADDSYDTSLTLLRFLGVELPELTVLGRARRGRACRRATAHAQGRVVLLWEADRGRRIPHAVLGFALSRLACRAAVVVRGRFVLADRMRALPVLLDTTGHGDEYEARFERAAQRRGLDVEIIGQRPPRFPWSSLLMGTLKGFPIPPALGPRQAKPGVASGLRSYGRQARSRLAEAVRVMPRKPC